MVHDVRLTGYENIHRTRGEGGERKACLPELSFCHTENHRNGEKKAPCCKWKQKCLPGTGSHLIGRGKRRGTGEGKGRESHKVPVGAGWLSPLQAGLWGDILSWLCSTLLEQAALLYHSWMQSRDRMGPQGCRFLQGGERWKGRMKIYGSLQAETEVQHQPPIFRWTGPWINHQYKLISAFLLVAVVVSLWCLLLLLTTGHSQIHTEVSPCFCSSIMNTARRALLSLKLSWRCLIPAAQHLFSVTGIIWWAPW